MTNEDAMYGAIARGDTNALRELLASDPSILMSYFLDESWLHWAAQDGQIEIMEELVKAGLSVDQLTTNGIYTPLKQAAGLGRYPVCEWLLDHGADINHGLGRFPTPIFGAIYSKSLTLVKRFVERGAELSATFGNPAIDVISYAERYGTPEIVNFLRATLRLRNPT
jgi:ankyrin repeat protein